MALTPDEKGLLEIVLAEVGDDEKRVHEGITKAIRRVEDRARRIYLRNILKKAAVKRIRAARKKYLTPG